MDRLGLGGAAILGALGRAALSLSFDVTVTCGTEGHPPEDPHSLGNAFDVRSHGLSAACKQSLLSLVVGYLAELDTPHVALVPTSGGLASPAFFGFLEQPDTEQEHFHFQVRHGRTFPVTAPLRTV
jgi:hypothetical protein